MATLREEIEADLVSGELEDLFEDVKWGRTALRAMVEIAGVAESFDDLGGPQLESVQEFKFRRKDILEIDPDLATYGEAITYAGRVYDVTTVEDRPDHPLLVVRATLRP